MYKLLLIGTVCLALATVAFAAAADDKKAEEQSGAGQLVKSPDGTHAQAVFVTNLEARPPWERVIGVAEVVFLVIIAFLLMMLRSDMDRVLSARQ